MSNEFLLSCELCKSVSYEQSLGCQHLFLNLYVKHLADYHHFESLRGKCQQLVFLSNSSNFGHHGLKATVK